jgi:transposase InsO family protein
VSGYYAWRNRSESSRARKDKEIAQEVAEIFEKHHKRYGSPRVHIELKKTDARVSRKRVARIMKEKGLVARKRRKCVNTTDSNHNEPVAPNLLNREFRQDELNSVWCGDITYIATHKGFVYLAVIMDLCSRRIIGWQISDRIDNKLICMALWRALKNRRLSKQGYAAMFHSDRGSQYASKAYRSMLERLGMTQSMSRKGNCWDNAVAESFFNTLKEESELNHMLPRDMNHASAIVYRYIEFYYNRQRMHSTLGFKSPIDFEREIRFSNLNGLH